MNQHSLSRQPLEGDFVETVDSLIFDVKGLLHPPNWVIAYVRYVPHPNGDRQRQGQKFRKIYDLDERRSFLTEFHRDYLYFDPVFNREMQGVPRNRVSRHYDPIDKLREMTQSSKKLGRLQARSLEMIDLLRSATDLPLSDFGVSGSLLVGLHTSTSDIDLIVYGAGPSSRVVEALRNIRHEGNAIRPYRSSELWKLRESRHMSASMPFDSFMWHEKRKSLQGVIQETDYFVRCVRRPSKLTETYGDIRYFPVGQAAVEAVVSDDSDAIFTPCRYLIDHVHVIEGRKDVDVSQIISFRGRFCQQAKEGERIYAKGSVERVQDPAEEYSRLVVGERLSDQFMVRGS